MYVFFSSMHFCVISFIVVSVIIVIPVSCGQLWPAGLGLGGGLGAGMGLGGGMGAGLDWEV